MSSAKGKAKDHAIAGAVSGCLTRLCLQPLDVIKIRFQLQTEPIGRHKSSKYQSFLQAILMIRKEEGGSALWKGHVPAQFLSITYGLVQFYCYHQLVLLMNYNKLDDDWRHLKEFAAGASAGSLATIASFPFDTIRTRLVAQSSSNMIYQGLLSGFQSILKTESFGSLFRGLSPTLLQIAPHTGLQFLFYNVFTDFYKKYFPNLNTSASNSMISGSIAGLLAKTAIYPLDLTRKRLQIQGFEDGRRGFGRFFQCQGFIDCLMKTVKDEGARGLFKGLFPSQLKAAAASALHFTFYEQTLRLLIYL